MTSARRLLPGFGLSLGYSVFYLSCIVLLPFAALLAEGAGTTFRHAWHTVADARVLHACGLSLGASLAAALCNGLFGFVTAWTLARYDFPGRRLADALVDLPFALPTAVAGIALTTLYAPHGPLGAPLARLGVHVAFTPLGVALALVFVGLPFVVRALQPVIAALPEDVEEAAACLGADRGQTFRRVVFPALRPALLTGMTLAFGRALGEYGSIVFISANLPFRTEILPLLIVGKLEQYDYSGAAVLGLLMLFFSAAILTGVHFLQRRRA
ncbi:MAG: sulfate ABC transporter permease subunit CysT [Verrucomicrobium sp.]|nr:sulfate ABC transporter permease subunit CysT [Verrucomicrobium sp.]